MALTIKRWLTQAKTLVNPIDAELILTNVFKAADRTYAEFAYAARATRLYYW